MKKNNKISISVIAFITFVVSILFIGTYVFYSTGFKPFMIEVKVDPAVDSAIDVTKKQQSRYCDSIISKKDEVINQKNMMIKDKDSAIIRLIRIRDSLSIKLDNCRQRNRDLIIKDTVRN
jgi:hypothetical protein